MPKGSMLYHASFNLAVSPTDCCSLCPGQAHLPHNMPLASTQLPSIPLAFLQPRYSSAVLSIASCTPLCTTPIAPMPYHDQTTTLPNAIQSYHPRRITSRAKPKKQHYTNTCSGPAKLRPVAQGQAGLGQQAARGRQQAF